MVTNSLDTTRKRHPDKRDGLENTWSLWSLNGSQRSGAVLGQEWGQGGGMSAALENVA